VGRSVPIVLLLAGLAAAPAAALVPGGGPATTDCLVEFGGTAPNYPVPRPRHIRCIDDDPACDADARTGRCAILIDVCANVTDPGLPACAPAALDDYTVSNPQPDTHPKHDFGFQTLQDSVNFLLLPLGPTERDRCLTDGGASPVVIDLPLRVDVRRGRYRGRTKTIRATLHAHTAAGTAVIDRDVLRLTCLPAAGADACAGVGGTFEQIQRQIFTPRCALPTCHSAVQPPHDLSLREGDTFVQLLGADGQGAVPTNPTAAAAGLRRVIPGDPARSFLALKLSGALGPGEGERMPFGGPYLDSAATQLVLDWITAGAPAAGWVGSPAECPHP
jgi:hypothetical protein